MSSRQSRATQAVRSFQAPHKTPEVLFVEDASRHPDEGLRDSDTTAKTPTPGPDRGPRPALRTRAMVVDRNRRAARRWVVGVVVAGCGRVVA
ncbi:MAG TPA: hypothetical protein VN408_01210 [Actinoplanes sp.]|nr:hypothetical protein [Actinoplanes sp.]